jgi:hypothetical protein
MTSSCFAWSGCSIDDADAVAKAGFVAGVLVVADAGVMADAIADAPASAAAASEGGVADAASAAGILALISSRIMTL